jgi:phage terminase large subunit-like protein
VSHAGDKVAKATAYRAQVSRGKVSVKEGPWSEDFIQEHLRFPNGKHDDQVDNGSALGRRMRDVRVPSVKKSQMRYGHHTGQHIIDQLTTPAVTQTRLA